MGLLDYVAEPRQSVAYLYPEGVGSTKSLPYNQSKGWSDYGRTQSTINDVFVFQFWPSQISDNYTPNWTSKNIPGASHPIYQWVSGNGRDISFTAQFVSEIKEPPPTGSTFNERVAKSSAANIDNKKPGGSTVLDAALLPSSRYTVNVSAAIAALQMYLYPSAIGGKNAKGRAKAPSKLNLVLPGTNIGRTPGNDGILCILRQASVTMESFFPDGQLRAASVSLKFSEIIQHSSGEGSKIRSIYSDAYADLAQKYVLKNVPEGGGLFI